MDQKTLNFLLNGRILMDLSGFFAEPTRTGIQRTTWELLRNWPNKALTPVIFEADGTVRVLPDYALEEMTAFFQEPFEEIEALSQLHHGTTPRGLYGLERLRMFVREQGALLPLDEALSAARAVLACEVFFDPGRVAAFEKLAEEHPKKFFLLTYDMILWLRTEFYPHVDWAHTSVLLNYLKIVRKAGNVSAISHATADEVARVRRKPEADDVRIFPLGADSFGARRTEPAPAVPLFSVLGTVEPRKYPVEVLTALKRLHDEGRRFEVQLFGKKGWLSPSESDVFDKIVKGAPWIQWHRGLPDTAVAEVIAASTAGIYVSKDEGFGLPPLECLHLGVPVVVSEQLPALRYVDPCGQLRLAEPTVDAIYAALSRLLDAKEAERLRREARNCTLPTWQACAEGMAAWIDEVAGPATVESGFWERVDRLEAARTVRAAPAGSALMPLFWAVTGRWPTLVEFEAFSPDGEEEIPDAGTLALNIGRAETGEISGELLLIYDILRGYIDPPLAARPSRAEPWDRRIHRLLLRLYTKPTGGDFVDAAYRQIFHRYPNPSDLADVGGDISKTAFVLGLISSDAYEGLHYKAHEPEVFWRMIVEDFDLERSLESLWDLKGPDFVIGCYRLLLGREPDRGGFGAHSKSLAQGAPLEEVAISMLISPEYMNRVQDVRPAERLAIRMRHGLRAGVSAWRREPAAV
ncbi:hypothetical protein DMC18_01265, partial [Caulobacter sp. D5]|uniref:glycosyltransferase n=1 Tax=Caulobacter sp. D5 TaxID=357400 RepID=UPI000D9A65AB